MRAAAKELEFERAAALRDEIQQIRLRVLEQDASVTVGAGGGAGGGAARRQRPRRADRRRRPGPRPSGGRGRRRRRAGHGGHERHGPARRGGAGRDASTATAGRRGDGDRVRLAARHPRRARRRRRLAGPLARPADLGPDGHARTSASARDSDRPVAASRRTTAATARQIGGAWTRRDPVRSAAVRVPFGSTLHAGVLPARRPLMLGTGPGPDDLRLHGPDPMASAGRGNPARRRPVRDPRRPGGSLFGKAAARRSWSVRSGDRRRGRRPAGSLVWRIAGGLPIALAIAARAHRRHTRTPIALSSADR